MIDSESEELSDFKFYCFNGKPMYCQVIKDRNTNETIDFFDMDWNLQPFTGVGCPLKPHSKTVINRPKNFDLMIKFAEKLSTGTFFLRVDFYEVNQKLYFGELTFYPSSGFGMLEPNEWNKILGDKIVLSEDEV